MGNPIKVLVLGKDGMLGSQVVKSLSGSTVFDVLGTIRTTRLTTEFTFDPLHLSSVMIRLLVGGYDYVVNCIGVIKPAINSTRIDNAIYINSVFPHELARCCEQSDTELIHISTDCVYSGISKDGDNFNMYTENDPHDALDLYGKSKSLGEPVNCMVLRTSIIGHELRNYRSLVSWFLNQEKECDGFENHYWNGITTNEYANICQKIMLNDWYAQGLYHIFSNTVDKSLLLTLLKRKYEKDIQINPINAEVSVDRTLGTVKDLCGKLQIPTIGQMIKEM